MRQPQTPRRETRDYRKIWIGLGICVAAAIVVPFLRDGARMSRYQADADARADRAVMERLEKYMRGIEAGIDNIAMLRSHSLGRPAEEVRRNEELAEAECQRIKGLAESIESQLLPFLPERTRFAREVSEVESAVGRIIREAGDCSDVFERL